MTNSKYLSLSLSGTFPTLGWQLRSWGKRGPVQQARIRMHTRKSWDTRSSTNDEARSEGM